jgi:hypothetical protein
LAITVKDDHCATCKAPIEEECIKFSTLWNWHANCFKCQTCQVDVSTQLQLAFIDSSKGVVYCKEHAVSSAIVGAERIRHLQQYITVLCNALSRLFSILKIDEKGFLV